MDLGSFRSAGLGAVLGIVVVAGGLLGGLAGSPVLGAGLTLVVVGFSVLVLAAKQGYRFFHQE